MSYRPNNDYNLDIRKGLVAGQTMVTIIGHDPSVPAAGPYGLSPQFGVNTYSFDQSAIDTTPAVVGVGSTDNTNDIAAGTGALTVRVIGLDASGDAQTEDVTMTGTTAANTVATFSAVHSLLVLTTGANNANTGTIYVGTGTFTAGVPAVRMISCEIGYNKSMAGYYVVPNAKTFYLQQFIATIGSSNKDVEVFLSTSTDGTLWYTQAPFGLEAGDFATPVIALPGLVAGTHLQLTVTGGAASTDVTAILAGVLIDD